MIDDFDWTFGSGDYDGDGEVSDFEEYAYFDDQEAEARAEREAASAYYYDADDDWQDYCEDGSDYGLDPYDFDSQEEYEEALEEAKEEFDEVGVVSFRSARIKQNRQKQTRQTISSQKQNIKTKQEQISEEKELTPEEKRKNHKMGVLFMGGFWIDLVTSILNVFLFIKHIAYYGSMEGCVAWVLFAILFGTMAWSAYSSAKECFANKINNTDDQFLSITYVMGICFLLISVILLIFV